MAFIGLEQAANYRKIIESTRKLALQTETRTLEERKKNRGFDNKTTTIAVAPRPPILAVVDAWEVPGLVSIGPLQKGSASRTPHKK